MSYLLNPHRFQPLEPLLLDDYSGATAAYSLRKLRSNYSGSAIRVRRSSNNAEQDIGFVNNQLDVASLQSFCSGTNGFITRFYDQSTVGVNAIQATITSQPMIVLSGNVLLENGKPTLSFDGADFLATSGLTFNATENTMIAVSKLTSVNANGLRLFGIGLYNDGRLLYAIPNLEGMRAVFNNNVFNIDNGISTTQNLTTMYNIATTGYIRQDGVQVDSGVASNASYGNENLFIGTDRNNNASTLWIGTIQEVIFYPTERSSDISDIETNINNFYSIY